MQGREILDASLRLRSKAVLTYVFLGKVLS
jgi:hypothetical protein